MLTLKDQNAYRQRYREMIAGWQPATEIYEATIRQYLSPATRLLDAGCGRGGAIEQLSGAGHWICGIDPDIRSLREHRLELSRAVALLDHLPFRSNSIDLVICSWVLEHINDPYRAFGEIARVLRPGGHFVTLTPNGLHPVSIINRLLARARPLQAQLVPRLYGRAEHDAFPVRYRVNYPSTLEHLGRATRLEPVSIQTISDPTYLAFNDFLFWLSCAIERCLPDRARVHIVADFVHQ